MVRHDVFERRPEKRDDTVDFALFVAFYISYFFEVSIFWNEQLLFPFFGSFLFALISTSRNLSTLRVTHLKILGLIFATLAVSLLTNLFDGEPFGKRVESLINMMVSITTGSLMCLTLARIDSQRISNFFLWVAVFLILISLLEGIPDVRAFSDTVRQSIYPHELVYEADDRDLSLYGAVRPKAFLREPSLVGIQLGTALAVWFLMGEMPLRPARIFSLLCLSAAGTWAIRSPTIGFFIVIVIFGAVMLPMSKPDPLRTKIGHFAGWLGLSSVFFTPLLLTGLASVSGGALDAIYNNESVFLRQIGPFWVALGTLSTHPLFGYGIGASEVLRSPILEAYVQAETQFPINTDVERFDFLLTNGFFQYWIVFGLLTGGVLAFLLAQLLRTLMVGSVLFVFLAASLALQTLSGISALWPSFLFFIFAAVARARSEFERGNRRGCRPASRSGSDRTHLS